MMYSTEDKIFIYAHSLKYFVIYRKLIWNLIQCPSPSPPQKNVKSNLYLEHLALIDGTTALSAILSTLYIRYIRFGAKSVFVFSLLLHFKHLGPGCIIP